MQPVLIPHVMWCTGEDIINGERRSWLSSPGKGEDKKDEVDEKGNAKDETKPDGKNEKGGKKEWQRLYINYFSLQMCCQYCIQEALKKYCRPVIWTVME